AARAAKPAKSGVAAPAGPVVPAPAAGRKRFIVIRNFPAGAIESVDAAAKKQINAKNAEFNVQWVWSFANPEANKTVCIYDGPNEQAIRDAANANHMPADEVVEVPAVVLPH